MQRCEAQLLHEESISWLTLHVYSEISWVKLLQYSVYSMVSSVHWQFCFCQISRIANEEEAGLSHHVVWFPKKASISETFTIFNISKFHSLKRQNGYHTSALASICALESIRCCNAPIRPPPWQPGGERCHPSVALHATICSYSSLGGTIKTTRTCTAECT